MARYKIVRPKQYRHIAVLDSLEALEAFRKEQRMHTEWDKLDKSQRSLKGEFKVSDSSNALGSDCCRLHPI